MKFGAANSYSEKEVDILVLDRGLIDMLISCNCSEYNFANTTFASNEGDQEKFYGILSPSRALQ